MDLTSAPLSFERLNASPWHTANGKVILFGEHAVVYGEQAIAASIPGAIRARASHVDDRSHVCLRHVSIPEWRVELTLCSEGGEKESEGENLIESSIALICRALNIPPDSGFLLHLQPTIPHASGLGASAALAVSSIRALAALFDRGLDEDTVNDIAYSCECLAHGRPSGLDNTLATFGGLRKFRRIERSCGEKSAVSFARVDAEPIDLLVVLSGRKGYTSSTVERVKQLRSRRPAHTNALFCKIGQISVQAEEPLSSANRAQLGALMNANQALLSELSVSCREIDEIISVALASGAYGAKLTGSGDGGAVIVIAEHYQAIKTVLSRAGYSSFIIKI